MMIPRTTANNVLITVVVAVLAAVAEGRLQGGTAGTTRATGGTHASTRVRGTANKSKNKKQFRAPERKLIQQEEDEILAKMEKEYQLEQASRKKAHEHAMKSRNKILSDAELLQELHAFDSPLHNEELQHQESKEEKKQVEVKKQEHQSLVDVELEKSIQKLKEESAKYQAKMKLKKAVAAQHEKVIAAAKKEAKAHKKEEEDWAKQMHEHTHGNDEEAAKDDEKRIMDMVLEEQ